MRTITYEERKKHGCWFCGDMVKKLLNGWDRCFCPHESCPYHKELAEYDSYEDYIEATGGVTNIYDQYLAGSR